MGVGWVGVGAGESLPPQAAVTAHRTAGRSGRRSDIGNFRIAEFQNFITSANLRSAMVALKF
jgi:hypothetical protein